jgi:hypothetical protein
MEIYEVRRASAKNKEYTSIFTEAYREVWATLCRWRWLIMLISIPIGILAILNMIGGNFLGGGPNLFYFVYLPLWLLTLFMKGKYDDKK